MLATTQQSPVTSHNSTSPASATAIDTIRASGNADAYHAITKERDRVDVRAKVQAMLDIDRLISTQGMTKKQAVSITSARLKPYHPRGFSASILSNYHKLWTKGGQKQDAQGHKTGTVYAPHDWQLFVPNYSNGQVAAAIQNADFVAHVRSLAKTVRDDAQGNALFDRLLDDWFGGKSIPGYGTIQAFCAAAGRSVPEGFIARARPENYPTGWSPKNLLRMRVDKTTSIYIRKGEHAAHSHWGDQLLRDRSKLMPLQLVTFDDVRFDLKVIMEIPNRGPQIVYPEAIFALDVATGLILHKAVTGNYLRAEDGDGGKKGTKRGLQQSDMRFLVKAMLEKYGLPRDWSIKILLENASASLSETDMRIFAQATGIEFENTGIIRNKLTNSGFVEQGGMPWQKGWVEAFFRLLHCRINHLPMTVGRRYDLTPGNIGGKSKAGSQEHYVSKMIDAAYEQGIPLSELDFSGIVLTLEEFHELLDEYILRLNWRTRHTLQGFDKIYEHQLNPGQYVNATDPQYAGLIPVGSPLSSRMEAPAERAMRLSKGHHFDPVHPHMLRVLGLHKEPITIASQRAKISIPGEPEMMFRDTDTAPMLAKFNGIKKALVGCLSHDNQCLHLFTNDDALEWVGSPQRVGRVDITDQHALDVRMGEVDRARQQTRDYASDLLKTDDLRYEQAREHNANRLATPAAQDIASVVNRTETAAAKTKADRQRTSKISEQEADEYFAAASAPAPTTEADEESPF